MVFPRGYLTQEEIFAAQDALLPESEDSPDEEMIESLFCCICKTTSLDLTADPINLDLKVWRCSRCKLLVRIGEHADPAKYWRQPGSTTAEPVQEISD